jgi:hypothetical protein
MNDYKIEDYYEMNFADGGSIEKTKEIITKKIGFSEGLADYFISRSQKFAVWLADIILKEELSNWGGSKKEYFESQYAKVSYIGFNYNGGIRQILDWLQHPMTPKQELRKLTFDEALEKAKKWHEELTVLGGDIDFKEPEKNQILKKYPVNSEGIEYYWVFIPSNYCDLESSRMGHCGRTGHGNTLISLRSVKPYGKGHTISDSHVTIAYGSDAVFYQVKGKKNQKPNEKYQPYIFDLIKEMLTNEELNEKFNNLLPFDRLLGETFVGFGSEYDSKEDYGYGDMSTDQIRELYDIQPNLFDDANGYFMLFNAGVLTKSDLKEINENNPEIFESFKNQNRLFENGVIDNSPSTLVKVEKSCDDVQSLLDSNRDTRRDLIEDVLCGDTGELVDGWSYHYENPSDLVDNLNKENEQRVIDEISRITGLEKSEVEENGIKYYLDGEDENFDKDSFDNIIRVLASAQNSADNTDYYNYLYKEIKNSLEELGEVHSLNDEGVKMTVDLSNHLTMDEISEKMDEYEFTDISDLFDELVSRGEIDLPRFSIDDRYSAYGSNEDFNSYVSDSDFESSYENGGSIPDLLSSQQVEDKLGRELDWWSDDIVYLSGIKYKKVYLRPEYKRVIE